MTALHCTALHCTALHWGGILTLETGLVPRLRAASAASVPHCTALYLLHCTILHYTVLHCTILHCTALHCTAN